MLQSIIPGAPRRSRGVTTLRIVRSSGEALRRYSCCVSSGMPLRRWIRAAIAALACSIVPAAAAQVFKCVDALGRVTYQETPCPAAQPGRPLELFLDNGSARDSPDVEARWRAAALQHEVLPGMPRRWVVQSLGQPAQVRPGAPNEGVREVWTYQMPTAVVRVGFVGEVAAWSRTEPTVPLAPLARASPATVAGEGADARRSKVSVDQSCDEVLGALGAPQAQANVRVTAGGAGAERQVDATRYIYEPVPGGLPVRLSFSCADGRVLTVSRDVPR